MILEDISQDVTAWTNADGSYFFASANDVISWDGVNWNILLDPNTSSDPVYITNTYTGIQYRWDGSQWNKSFEGVYDKGSWRLIL